MNILITGSTSGLGLALALKFLELDNTVVISSRNPDKVKDIVQKLNQRFNDKVFGIPCDVTKPLEVKSLANEAVHLLHKIDFWINNAGTSYKHGLALIDNSDEMLEQIVDTNLLGTLLGCREALKIMIPQGSGHIINIAGKGTEGGSSKNLVAYASTKRALDVLHKSLIKEIKNEKIGVHLISPGMVMTKLLFQDNTPLRTKKVFNILAEHPCIVADKLVPKILSFKGTGKRISLLDNKKAVIRFLTSFRFKNKFFDKKGNLITTIDPLECI